VVRGPVPATPPHQYGKARQGLQELCEVSVFQYLGMYPENGIEPRMNAPHDIEMKTEDVLRLELEVFKREHRDLDEAIQALQERGTSDQLTIRRLKKQKLALKDKIAQIEDRLTPDIIA